ncbi:MAG: hypothetical protein DMF63_17120 [Acidobacteria bacterium]|nr:MAG: hypothetical protein DMF63_17120 [Acidobacteriota bacterium]
MQELYYFKAPLLNKHSATAILKGSREWIERYIQLNEFGDRFGGYVTWRSPDIPTDQMAGEGLGVWGQRNISRLRRILRERCAEFEIINGEGPKQDLLIIATVSGR